MVAHHGIQMALSQFWLPESNRTNFPYSIVLLIEVRFVQDFHASEMMSLEDSMFSCNLVLSVS
jgi:hypothetical protein